jgi:hypothetical protein
MERFLLPYSIVCYIGELYHHVPSMEVLEIFPTYQKPTKAFFDENEWIGWWIFLFNILNYIDNFYFNWSDYDIEII